MNKKVAELLNEQFRFEFESAYLYLSMASQAEALTLKGLANWMYVQHQEEHTHAMNIFKYLHDRGHQVIPGAIEAPQSKWSSSLDILKASLEHEKKVTARINKLMATAIKEDDFATSTFLQWYVTEQVQEESVLMELIGKYEMADTKAAVMILDSELATRTFSTTLPVKGTPVQLA